MGGKTVTEAMVQMKFSVKRRAGIVGNILNDAAEICNKEYGLDRDSLYVAEAVVGRGSYRPKVRFRARGRVNIHRIPTTHLRVLVKDVATRPEPKKRKKPYRGKRGAIFNPRIHKTWP